VTFSTMEMVTIEINGGLVAKGTSYHRGRAAARGGTYVGGRSIIRSEGCRWQTRAFIITGD
jgi:hypothetical protein